ncbi:MAG: NAD(P)/FAD-dependent oxidoreductase [Anaerolineae bacterium]|nr:NAD(P)/FAD-dependent oxidoreductase [Anaerolineae bacterium]
MTTQTTTTRPEVVIIGAGFGGLFAARTLADKPVDVLLIDRQNFHTFTPLLYQVATSGLDPSEIAYPVRGIFRRVANVRFLMGEVHAIDHAAQAVNVQANGHTHRVRYDYLIVAAGSVNHYFGHNDVARHAFDLKTLADAVVLRNHILKQFERAAWSEDPAYREAATTLVVVGGGPTGLETAGALYELSTHVLRREFGEAGNITPRVVLVEAAERLLAPYPAGLQQAALEQLESLGVEVILNDALAEADAEHVRLASGRTIPTHTLIWSAGVQGSPLADMLDVPLARGRRVPVDEMLAVPGRAGVYVVGDMAYLEDADGQPYPQMIPAAKQQGILAAQNILRRVRGEVALPFHYRDRGIMATIGRSRAVAWLFNRIPLRGYIAWIAWLSLHLLWLMGFRNQLNVLVNWVWNYFTYDRSVRLILEHDGLRRSDAGDEAEAAADDATAGVEYGQEDSVSVLER